MGKLAGCLKAMTLLLVPDPEQETVQILSRHTCPSKATATTFTSSRSSRWTDNGRSKPQLYRHKMRILKKGSCSNCLAIEPKHR